MQKKFKNKQMTTAVNKGIDISIIDDEEKCSPDKEINNYVPDGQGTIAQRDAKSQKDYINRVLRGEAD